MDMYYRSPSVTQDICDIDLQCSKMSTQPRIDIMLHGSAKERLGKTWAKWFHGNDIPGRKADCPYFVAVVNYLSNLGKEWLHAMMKEKIGGELVRWNATRDFMKKVNEIIKKKTQYLLSDTLMLAGATLDPKALYTSKLATHHSAILAVTLAIKKLAHSPIETSIAIEQFTRTFSKKEKLFGSLEARSSALHVDANPEWFSNSRSKSRPILDEYDDDDYDWDAPGSFLIEELQMGKLDVTAFKRNLGLGKNSRCKKPLSQLDEEEEFEDDYESDSPHGSPLYDEPWDICSDDEGNNSVGVDWLEDKSGGDVAKNKSYCTEGHGCGREMANNMITFVGDSYFGKHELIFKCFC
ncbi:hypothetical protein ZEAMMB73_Zm00001d044738 [Zea mays]|uniref:Uncharacterized protein n=1 Tax=Zea mays TaxID=4577 RepID=A0A1D6NR08_MAIZE|nr:hypothetical protein ZEAMMB73_Zm00001d044738 [Zea mays]